MTKREKMKEMRLDLAMVPRNATNSAGSHLRACQDGYFLSQVTVGIDDERQDREHQGRVENAGDTEKLAGDRQNIMLSGFPEQPMAIRLGKSAGGRPSHPLACA